MKQSILVALVAVLAGCGGGSGGGSAIPTTPAPVTHVMSVTPSTVNLSIAQNSVATVTVSETNYSGSFTRVSMDGPIQSVRSAGDTNGSSWDIHTGGGQAGQVGHVVFADSSNNTTTVTVNITP